MDKTLVFERMNGALVDQKLNNLSTDVNSSEKPRMVQLVIKPSKNKDKNKTGSPKYNWHPNVPFPALVKSATKGRLAAYNCVTGKHELLPAGTYYEPTPLGDNFEYKGHRYRLKDNINGCPRYELEK